MNYTGKRILAVDFETFYDTKGKYTLKTKKTPKGLHVARYIRDERFKAHGMAYRFLDEERTHWITGDHVISGWVASIDWANTVLVAHNIRFDGSILRWRFNMPAPYAYMDTVGLARAVLGGNVSNYSLKRLAEYLDLPPKGELSCDGIRTPNAEQLAALGEYCKVDTDICKGIYEKLIGQFPLSQLFSMDWTIRCFVDPKLVLNQFVLKTGVAEEKARRENVIRAAGVEKSVLSSNKQFAQYLLERGFAVRTKISGRTGKEIPAFAKTDTGLDAIKVSNPELYRARIASKANLLETRGEALLEVAKTGAFPFDIGYSGASGTHRYAGGSGGGGNPQNFTKKSFLREAVEPPEGYSLIVGDYAAIEARFVAWLAKEPKLMSAFSQDMDVYSLFASIIYERPINKKDNPKERDFGKECILALGYNMGWRKFQIRVKTVLGKDLPDAEAKRIVKLYRETYFNVPKLWENAQNVLPLIASGKIGCLWFAPFIKVRKNTLILPSGLPIHYTNLRFGDYFDPKVQEHREGWHYDSFDKNGNIEAVGIYGGMLIENICQALAGELCREGIEKAEIRMLDCLAQIHDEIMAIHPIGREKEGVLILKTAMEQVPSWLPNIKLKAEVGYGKNWNTSKV